jgi:hypothetical protein
MKVLARIMSKTFQLEGATALFHANSVATARTLLEEGAPPVLGQVAGRRLTQTPQASDSLDKGHGTWNEILPDAVDIHNRARGMVR